MKKRISGLLGALLIFMLACNVGSTPTQVPASPTEVAATTAPTVATSLSQSLTMQTSPFEEKGDTPPYTITAQIPFLEGSSDPRVATFNTVLKQVVDNDIEAFKKDVLAFASTPPILGGSSFDLRYTVLGQRGEIWSIQYQVEYFADGAAHPAHYSVSLNYDLENSREITLDELFTPGSNYLQVLSDLCKADLSKRDIGFTEGFTQGADPLPENYTRWNLSNEGFLVITFDEYQVAPYAAGPQTVTIPFSEIQSIANPNGILSLFVQ